MAARAIYRSTRGRAAVVDKYVCQRNYGRLDPRPFPASSNYSRTQLPPCQIPQSHIRAFSTGATRALPAAPKSKDRGPPSKEDTQTDFTAMNILSNTPIPTTAVDACMEDGFALDSGLKVTGSGVLLVCGEAFKWRPWQQSKSAGKLLNAKKQFDVDSAVWGLLDVVWPKPDLLVIGTGKSIAPLSPKTRDDINRLGIRIEVQDTRNAAAQFNLLATERGVEQVAAALVPIGWRD